MHATQSHERYAFPLPPRLLTIPGVRALELEVVEVGDLGRRMRRLVLAGAGLDGFTAEPGQDVMLVLGGNSDRPLSRRYTIRRHDSGTKTLELNIVAHGIHGPGAEWAASTRVGDRVNGVGPRGKIFINAQADWHLFLGDETAAPGYLAMLEALSSGVPGSAYLEVTAAEDELPTSASGKHEVLWLHRGVEVPAWSSTGLRKAVESLQVPSGRGHVYVAGEVQMVAALREALVARGLVPEQLSPKAYWGRAKANANNGEPEKDLRAEVSKR
jgi:NADPH-dependent ferric siderophore reductase